MALRQPRVGGRRLSALAAVLGLTLAGLVGVTVAPAYAAPSIAVSKSADAQVLAGGTVHFTLTASNPGTELEFNTSFRDQLAPGLTYVPGSTTPADVGNPQITTSGGSQVLTWSDVADMRPTTTVTLSFDATVDPDVYPVGSSFPNTGSAYASTDPEEVPQFPGGTPGAFTEQATSNQTTTTVSALDLSKSVSGAPEGELMRGVHQHPAVYTLTLTNTTEAPTQAVSLIDFVPAGMEFLGCGAVDNTPGGAVEYPGSGRLTQVPAVGANCPAPAAVDTVSNPAGLPAGVYTRIRWQVGSLGVGQTYTARYAAGIPQQSNTMTFPSGEPTPASLGQAANLDNNTGASTRETASEIAMTNTARAVGNYTGPVDGGVPAVLASDTSTVSAEDVAIQKSVSPTQFNAGGIATYTLTVRVSEYRNATGISITDDMPAGLCPLEPGENYSTDGYAGCGTGGSAPTGADFADVDADADGSFAITFSDIDVAHDGTATITYQARMRTDYPAGAPVTAGDGFTNEVSLTATTTARPGTGDGPAQTVEDESQATLSSARPTITKLIQPRSGPGPYTCSNDPADYIDPTAADKARVSFDEGDRVCFLLRADFPGTVATKNVTVSDVVPTGMTYENDSAHELGASVSTATATRSSQAPPTWQVGDVDGGDRFVEQGQVFVAVLSAIVTTPATGPAPQALVNRVKLGAENSDGSVGQRRDDVTFYVTAPPPMTIQKSATHEGGAALDSNHTVDNGEVVPYTVTVRNGGTAANGNDDPIVGPDVWDPLPTGITCAAITLISDAGVCTNPGASGHPTFSGNTTRSAIRWNLPDTVVIAPGATRALTYRMRIPTDASVATSFTNNASVASYGTNTDTGSVVQHRPASNIDTTTPPAQVDAPAANTSYTVRTQLLLLTKTNVTAVVEPSNNATPDAVVGERITYTITGTVPGHSSVANGVISDPLLAQLAFVSATTSYSLNGGAFVNGTAPGFTFASGTGTLTFPTTYTNSTGNDQRFRVTVVAQMDTDAGSHGTSYTNTSRFATSASGGSVTATSVVRVVEPQPTLTKTDDDNNGIVVAEQPIEFTVTAGNAAGRPPLHDAFVIDCVPDGMTVTDPGTATSGPSNGTDGCATGQTRLQWTGLDLDPGETVALTYTAEVDPSAISLASYTNTATLTGSSLDDDANDDSVERVYTATANDTVQIAPAEVSKTVDEPTATIGERRTFTATLTVPENVNFYDAIVSDLLPGGFDPDTLRVESVSCAYQGGGSCPVNPSPLPRAAGPGGATYIGVNFGDVTSDSQVRVLTAVYSVVVADIGSNAAGVDLTNSARAQWNLVDSAPDADDAGDTLQVSSNTATATVILTEPHLAIDKSVSNANPTPGDTFTYTIDVTNPAGANVSDAFDVTVVDTVPPGVVVNAGAISDGGVLTGGGAGGGGTITWQLAGPIGTSTPEQLTYTAQLSSPPPAGPATNTADITEYYSLDDDVAANSADRVYDGPEDDATVQPAVPHVTVSKEVVGGQLAYIGQSKGWHVQVVSDGDVTAEDVDVVDVLPPSWTYDAGTAVVSVNGAPLAGAAPVVSNGGRTLTWTDLTDLAVDDVLDITFTATPGAGVVDDPGVGHSVAQVNTASVTAEDAQGSTGPSGSPYNSGPASAVARIDSADLVLEKSHSDDAVAGEDFSWTVTVRNAGPDPAVGPFRVTDTFPPGLLAPTGSGPGWQCSTGTTTITCSRSNAGETLAAGDEFPPLTISGAVPTGAADNTTVVNTAAVTDRTYDPDPSNNRDDDPTLVTAEADLQMVKTLMTDMVAGQTATYRLQMANNGPSVHRGIITVVDPVPSGTTYVSNVAPGWTFTNVSGVLTWTRSDDRPIGPLPGITVTVRVDSGRTAAVTNTARITGTLPDPVPANNADSATDTPGQEADLILQKAHEGTFTAGSTGTYHFTVLNAGPSTAQASVRITDTLPGVLTYQGFTSVTGAWTCGAAGQVVTCTLSGALTAGSVAEVDIEVLVDAGAGTAPILNSAHVQSPTTDPIPANNDDDDNTDLDVIADLAIAKSHTGVATAGENLTYTLDVSNNGPSNTAGPVTVFDLLPQGTSYVGASAPWSCATPDASRPRVLRCTNGAGLTAGQTSSFQLTVAVAPDAGPATLENRAVVNGPPDGSDSDLTNNVATDPTEVVDDVEIQVLKTVTGPNPVQAGAQTTFSVVAHNSGPSTADDVTVTDDLPTGMTIVSASGAGWTCTGGVIPKCVLPTLAPGAVSPPIELVVKIGSGVADGTVLTNRANVATSTDGDSNAGNTSTADVTVETAADLALDKTHPGGDQVIAGETTRFELDVTNLGPSDARAPIRIVDDLPVGMTYVSADGGWTCTAAPAGIRQQVTCELAQDLGAGEDAPTLGITVLVSASAVPGTVTNSAEVSSPTDDPDPSNNDDSVTVDVERAADLSVVKTHTGEAHIGDPVTFTLAVHNAGPSSARSVVVEDTLPAGTSYVSATGDDWTCDASGALVTCTLAGALAVDADAPPISLTVDVLPEAYPAFTNRVEVDAGPPDPDTSNNTDTDTLDVPPLVNLEIDKTHVGPFQVGNRAVYRLTVQNDGPTPDPGPMTVVDRLPQGLQYVAARGRGWECGADGRVVRCTHDGLPVGATAHITVVVRVLPDAYSSVTNVAVVRTPSEETELRDNAAEDQAAVRPLVHLAVDKEVVSATPERVVWDITTTNLGPNVTVEPVVLVDDLPRGLSYVDAHGPGWTCSAVSDTVTCTKPPTMEVDESSTVRLVTSVDKVHPDEITNVATASGGGSADVVDDDATVPIPSVPGQGPDSGGGNPNGGPDDTGPGSLPGTGGPPWALPVLGLLMLAAGTGLVVAGRRRSGETGSR